MKFKVTRHKYDSFQIAVGEDGAVIVYSEAGYAKNKLFVRSTDPSDSDKLKELLIAHPHADIHIYIDTLDQSYIQRTLPGVGQIGINSVAQKRLDKETPKDHFKGYVQIGRSPIGRQDWIYTFISAANEPPISTWINFLMPFKNVIAGIHFMPVELYSVVQKLKKLAIESKQFKLQEQKDITKKGFLSFLSPKVSSTDSRWELYFSQDKTGGFRQVAFQDGKIIFSRLINNINDPSAEVVAGNIEQEIANSIEYMSRLSLGKEKEIDVYLVLSAEIIKYLRKDKVKANNLFLFTPFELAHKLKVPEASSEKDKFADPTVLTAFSKQTSHIMTLHTDASRKVALITNIIKKLGIAIYILIPTLIIGNLYLVNDIIDIKTSIKQIQNKTLGFAAQLNEQNNNLSSVSSKIQESLKVDHVNEIADVYKFLNKNRLVPTDLIFKISPGLPQYSRIKSYKWDFKDEFMIPTNKSAGSNLLAQIDRPYAINSELEIVIKGSGKSIEDLEQKYKAFDNYVKEKLKDYTVVISELPQNFSFQDITKPISLKAKIVYPQDEKVKQEKLQPAQLINSTPTAGSPFLSSPSNPTGPAAQNQPIPGGAR